MAASSAPGELDGPAARETTEAVEASEATARGVERVLLAGASGGTGRRALALLATSAVSVRALTSSPGKADRLGEWGADEVVVGDLLEAGAAARAVEGCDAVVSAVGTRPRDVYRAGPLVDGKGNANLVAAAADAGVHAFAMVSALGVGPERPGPMGRLFRLVVGPTIRAKGRAEAAIRESGLRYTILRAAALAPGGASGDVVAAEAGAGLWGVVSRADVARLAVAAPFTPDAADRTLEVARNPLLRGRGASIDWRLP